MNDAVDKWFLEHPRSVNESYFEHQKVAGSFALRLFGASCQCLLHALVPRLFERSASATVDQLHSDMVTHRVRNPAPASDSRSDSPLRALSSVVGTSAQSSVVDWQ
jgi:hypothetical protein